VKKLVIVSTKVAGGKGGIASALQGYMNGLDLKGIPYQVIESHVEDRAVLVTWFIAFWKILVLSFKHRNQVVFWFHCGAWFSMIRKFSLAVIPRILGCKTVGHIHSPTFNRYLSKGFLSKCLVKLAILPYKELVVLTPWWQKLLLKHGINKNTIVSPNPNNALYCQIAQDNNELLTRIDEHKKSFQILTMARLIEGKGVELVINALALLPSNYTLIIAGDGPLKAQLEKQAINLSVSERITFVGWAEGSKKEALLRDVDILCLPSTYDSFGMVFIEAMAFNLPIVAYGWGPIKDVVTDDVGLCCSELSDKNVSDTIVKLSRNLDKYQRNGAKRVLENYTPTVVIENIVQLLD